MTQAPRRFGAALLAATLAAAALAGCGEGDGSPFGIAEDSADTVAAGSAQPGPLTEETAREFGRAVNLRASDLPYAEQQPPEDAEDRREDLETTRRMMRAYERCLGGGVPEFDPPLADVESPEFQSAVAGGFHSFQSSVEVMRSAEVAVRQNEIYRSLRGQACIEHVFPRIFEEELAETPEIGRVEMRPLPLPLAGLEGAFAYRFSTEVTIGAPSPRLTSQVSGRPVAGESVPFFIDLFAFLSGPAEISLTVSAAPRPMPESVSRNLLRLLEERAEAHGP